MVRISLISFVKLIYYQLQANILFFNLSVIFLHAVITFQFVVCGIITIAGVIITC
jgi:hypothetical protein